MSHRGTIFVADDNSAILHGLERALTGNGYRVRATHGGRELLALLASAPEVGPDLLLLDVMMPGMTGLAVLQELRADSRWRELPVVLITATSDESLPVSALRDGAADFLTKPFRLEELLARIDSHIRRYRELRDVREQSRIRLQGMDLIQQLNRVAAVEEMFQLVADRSADILGVRRCSVLMVEQGMGVVRVQASSDSDTPESMILDLQRYPEVRVAVETGEAVCIRDVSTSPLYAAVPSLLEPGERVPALRSVVAVPFRVSEHVCGVLLERSADDEPVLGDGAEELARRIVSALVHAYGRVEAYEHLVEQRRRLHHLAHTDDLTGCATRRSVLRYLDDELAAAQRQGHPLSLVIIDIDRFKQVNDNWGHPAGDEVLKAVGNWLTSAQVRGNDVAGRYGGDEFVVVLPQTALAGAMAFAERARAHFDARVFRFGGRETGITLSLGVAAWPEIAADNADDLIAQADAALYQAKQMGRNRAEALSPTGTASLASA